MCCSGDDVFGSAAHFLGRPAGEGEEEHPIGIGAPHDSVGNPVGEGVGLAGSGAGQDEQGAFVPVVPMFDGFPLIGVEGFEIVIWFYCAHVCYP
jgi:hypothetical protein